MTLEQKAKAYDRTLEQAKKELNACGSLDCDAARQIFRFFPELHEEEKPLTPFQQCLNCILRRVYYAEVPDKKVNEFILNVVRTRTDELIKLAKRHEYTDCQLHESEDAKMIQEFNDWLCEEIECRTSSLCDEKDRRTLNMLCYVLTKVKEWLEKQKEQKPIIAVDSNELLKILPKPAEWSEKDEKNLELVTDCVYEFYPNPVMKYKLKDWLTQRFKFIHPQPHWKPSEEQMRSLRDTIVNTKGYQYSMYLPELCEQLEKLM